MKGLSYYTVANFHCSFFLILLIFHPLQWLSLNTLGHKGHGKVVDCLNFFLVKSMLIIGSPCSNSKRTPLPENASLIFVSNHQSTFDIPPIGWFFRKHSPKFVAKIELGRGIPSVSYNLKYGGAALINRKDPKQAITELVRFSKRIHEKKWGAIIFPEGTRSRDGSPKKFATNGLKVIYKV